ncbi:MAG: response regulator [Geminicoccaceae bacterium]
MPEPAPDLSGFHIMLVEDDTLIALDLEASLNEAGCAVLGPMATVAAAIAALAENSPDGAVLDVNLGREMVYPVADALADRGVPFVFLTGYGRDILPERHHDRALLAKPFQPDELMRELVRVVRQGR